ncbi:hypothetical protein PF005_g1813 [Phytophthora fragariae]|uniref:Uncharacterized protein n=1 Tax=Phytophthora fragariae TaxID=53985 RepID=A0A6A3MCY5_9STRA|nr:hypothetical protein PF003_g32354 [Phytophthora fragariae]KAE8948486.1 hypothetical protein PF009_g1941 [Phytophthora fragariae]KAE9029366.1 hypothetical protein PF011_g1113 [Phytophthora fragariae]KAE9136964.1 hypothetical protein PF010_g1494 [Phytophthora fragariae]KAE9137005.1 hypothetical protein PF007_g1976 [Phytophthora fragariae]
MTTTTDDVIADANSAMVKYNHRLTRGVPRHHKSAYLLRRWRRALQYGADLEAAIIRAHLAHVLGDEGERPLKAPFNATMHWHVHLEAH